MAESDRDVVFRLKAEPDKGADRVFDEWKRKFEELYKTIDEGAVKSAKRRHDDEKKLRDQSFREGVEARRKAQQQEESLKEQAAKRDEQRRRDAEKSRVAELKRAQREQEDAMARMRAANMQMTDSLHMAMEGTVKLGQGIAMLGIAGEEDIQKLVSAVVRLKGVTDAIRGTVELWRGAKAAVEAYRASLLATAAVTATLRAGGTVAGQIEDAGGLSETLTGGAAGGIAGQAAQRVAQRTILTKAISGLVVAGKAASAALLTLPGAAAAATGALFLAGRAISEGPSASWSDPEGTLGPHGFWGGVLRNDLILRRAQDAAFASEERAARMAADLAGQREIAGFAAQRVGVQASGAEQIAGVRRDAQIRAIERELEAGGITGTAYDVGRSRRVAGLAGDELSAARGKFSTAREHARVTQAPQAKAEVAVAERGLLQAHERAIEASEERLKLERQIRDEKLAGVREAIAGAREEIGLKRQLMQAERDRLMSAQERFGLMTPDQQARKIRLKQRADRGERLSVDELRELQGVGTQGVQAYVSSEARQRAATAGFGQYFGGVERQRISEYRAEIKNLNVKIEGQKEFQVKIERESGTLVEAVVRRIAEMNRQRDAMLVRQIQEGVQKDLAAAARQQDQRQRAERQAH
jgi:hypothetical protein